jgi:hypothetical protein
MHAVVSSPERPAPLTISGRMAFNTEDRTRAILTMPDPETGDTVKMEAVGDGTVMYIRSSQFGSLPEGREWMGLDFSFGEDLDTPLPADADAKGELELLEGVTGKVQKLGKEDVRGVPTTRYRGKLDVSEQAEGLREVGADGLASHAEDKGTPLQVEAWIDADGLIRRMRLVSSQPEEGGKGSTTIDMRMDFYDFGIDPEIEVPEPSEVFDATALAKDEIGLSNDD